MSLHVRPRHLIEIYRDTSLIFSLSVLPPFFYGPFAPGHTIPDADLKGLSSNGFIYLLLMPQGFPPPTGFAVGRWIDVRDVARAVVLSLCAPPSSAPGIGRKRIIVSGEWFSFADAVDYLAVVRPELKSRLSTKVKEYPPEGRTLADLTRAKEVLGLDNLKSWKETVLDSVDNLVKLEKEWASKGLTPHY